MKKTSLIGFASCCSIALLSSAAAAQTQWIQDTLSDQCSTASQAQVADATRKSIEESVSRAEASIRAPASVADLSCMSDLIGANIDVFSSNWGGLGAFDVEGMINNVVGGLKSGLSVETLSSGVQRAICDFAKEKFEERTGELTGSMDDIVSGASSVMPDFTDGFGLLNMTFNSTGADPIIQSAPGTLARTDVASGVGAGSDAGSGTGTSTIETEIQNIWNAINGGN